MNVQKYLDRIDYSGPIQPDLNCLKILQKSHLLRVPFENLDIHYGRSIRLDIGRISQKILDRKRGGFCYELNGLFHFLLKAIGFEVRRVSARVFDPERGFGQEYDHLANIVRLDAEEYLTDVGFGSFMFGPLKMELNKPQEDEQGTFRLEKRDERYLQVSKRKEDKWIPQYMFSSQARAYTEFAGMCRYHQSHSDSHFTQKRLCTLATETGRITITGNLLKIKDETGKREEPIENESEFRKLLTGPFGMLPDIALFSD